MEVGLVTRDHVKVHTVLTILCELLEFCFVRPDTRGVTYVNIINENSLNLKIIFSL